MPKDPKRKSVVSEVPVLPSNAQNQGQRSQSHKALRDQACKSVNIGWFCWFVAGDWLMPVFVPDMQEVYDTDRIWQAKTM